MKLDSIKHGTERLQSLVDGWQTNGEIPRIERDMALEELRRLYDKLLDIDLSAAATKDDMSAVAVASVIAPVAGVAEENVVAEALSTEASAIEPTDISVEKSASAEEDVEPGESLIVADDDKDVDIEVVDDRADVEYDDDDDDVIDIDALLGLSSMATSEVAAAEGAPIDRADDTTPASKVSEAENVATTMDGEPLSAQQSAPGELFAMEDIPVSKGGGRKIISIYNSAGTMPPMDAAEETAAPERVVETQPKRLADVLGGDKRVLGDKVALDDMPTTPFNRITDLRKAIGINDKFLMIKDLFGGNAVQYEATIDTLNEFDDIDDCMIYIAENFAWNPDSEGAKLLVSLIERKLA